MKVKPGPPNNPCAGYGKSPSELTAAISIVGKSVELAASLKERIEALSAIGRPPIAPHRPGFDLDAWRILVAYLIEERRLIEFLLGPTLVGKQGHDLIYKYSDDICLDCFRPGDGQHWRFSDDEVRTVLNHRAGRINKRLTHFSWTLTQPDTRLDAGIWNTVYLNQVIDGLEGWSGWLETVGASLFAETLRHSLTLEVHGRQNS